VTPTATRTKKPSREEKKARTRTRLLDAAAVVFARRGFAAATLDEVAEEAGLTKGAVYSNFESKDDLIVALLDERLDRQLMGVATQADPHGDVRQQAEQAAAAYLRTLEHERESYLLAVEFSVHIAREPELRRKFGKRYRDMRDSYARLIEEYAEASGLTLPLPADEMMLIYFALMDGLAMAKLTQADNIPDDIFAKALALIAGTFIETGSTQ
jgi:AcrR family transcriptional regulator